MKLKEIHIKNFRGIKNQKIESIEDALILIGKNNAGKGVTVWVQILLKVNFANP